jgi:hypothetical protein
VVYRIDEGRCIGVSRKITEVIGANICPLLRQRIGA